MPPADQSDAFAVPQLLPDQLPAHPFDIFKSWWDEAHARRVQPNPHAMCLATADPDGRPAARMVLCKGMNLDPAAGGGYFVFYTNRQSRKAAALEANPRAALLFHWDDLDRQVRIEGPVTRSPDEESDRYFASRPLESRIGAWASDQSQPVASRDELLSKVAQTIMQLGVMLDDESATIPRPPHWGGYRVWIETMELWVGGPGRVHDRARWTRRLRRAGDGYASESFAATRLQP
ncbi:MAG: pyridoxamine 5'-phosphate oxidase [Phycisphaerales bacterium]